MREQHEACISFFRREIESLKDSLLRIIRPRKTDKAFADEVTKSIRDLQAANKKMCTTLDQLRSQVRTIKAKSFFKEIDIERPTQSRVLTEISDIRSKIEQIRESIKESDETIGTLGDGVINMEKANISPTVFDEALKPVLDKCKVELNRLLTETNRCDQSLINIQKDFKNSLRAMSVTESTYTKVMHSRQVNLASACRLDIVSSLIRLNI